MINSSQMKKLLVLSFTLLLTSSLALSTPSPSSAATCTSVPDAHCGIQASDCNSATEEVNNAYVCPQNCNRFGCFPPQVFCCVPKGTSLPSCSTAGGGCQASCTAGTYEVLNTDCSGASPHCCKSLGGGPPALGKPFCDSSGNPSTSPDDANPRVLTALGCLPLKGKEFVNAVLPWAVGIAGGIALVMIGYSGFILVTSGGDPKRVQAGRELLTASISGLILIALSVILLNFIGIKILNLGGLGFNL